MTEEEPTRRKPKAGWYPHPSMAATRRYWDGEKWTEHIAPDDARKRPSGNRTGVDPSYAWTLAVLPLLWIPVDYFAPDVSLTSWVIFASYGIGIGLAFADADRIRTTGARVNRWWILLAPVAYLIARTRAVKSTPAIPLAWVGATGIWVLAAFTFAAIYDYPEAEVEAEIEAWFADNGSSGTTVDCPSIAGRPGDTFDCIARSTLETLPVTVTLTDDGGYKWVVE